MMEFMLPSNSSHKSFYVINFFDVVFSDCQEIIIRLYHSLLSKTFLDSLRSVVGRIMVLQLCLYPYSGNLWMLLVYMVKGITGEDKINVYQLH